MRVVQRVSAWLGWSVLFAISIFLILEGTGLIDATWREWIGEAALWVAEPSLAPWLAALVGALLGLAALVVLVAQFARVPMTRANVLAERSVAGTTVVNPVVIRRAAVQRLREVDGVVDAAPFSHGRRLDLHLTLETGAKAPRVEEQARAALDESFWSMLGVPLQPVDLTLRYMTVSTSSSRVN